MSGISEQQSPSATRDPVCGMTVTPDEGTPRFTFDGQQFFFCTEKCLEKFKADPNRYAHKPARAQPSGAESPDSGAIEYTCPMHPQIVRSGPGICPICGMALEPRSGANQEENAELADMTRRFWIAAPLTVLEVALAMLPVRIIGRLIGHETRMVLEILLTTPVVLWAGAPFFVRGYDSIRRLSLNMFTLISIGVGVAYAYSVAAALFPDIFPASARERGGTVPSYFEAAAVITTLVLLARYWNYAPGARPAVRYEHC